MRDCAHQYTQIHFFNDILYVHHIFTCMSGSTRHSRTCKCCVDKLWCNSPIFHYFQFEKQFTLSWAVHLIKMGFNYFVHFWAMNVWSLAFTWDSCFDFCGICSLSALCLYLLSACLSICLLPAVCICCLFAICLYLLSAYLYVLSVCLLP